MVTLHPNEETPLIDEDGDNCSSVPASSDDGGSEQPHEHEWPSTFERSISLLSSPIISAGDADNFSKSPRPGGLSFRVAAARRREQEKYNQTTPELRRAAALQSARLTGSERDVLEGGTMQRVQSLDFKTTRNDILHQQEKRLKEAQEYRKRLLKEQQKTRNKSTAKPDGKSSVTQCMFNFANILMGVGLLGLPYCLRVAGFYGGIFCLVVFATMTCRTAILIGRQLNGDSRPSQCFHDSPYKSPLRPGSSTAARMFPPMTSFPEIARTAFGNTGCLVLSIVLYFEVMCNTVLLRSTSQHICMYDAQLFSCIAIFLVSIGDHLHQLIPGVSVSMHMTFVAAVSMIPTILLRTPALLSYLSMVGAIATVAVVLSVVLSAVIWDTTTEPVSYQVFEVNGLPLAFGLVAYCFSGHAIVPSIYTSMEKPQEFDKMVYFTFGIVVTCCVAVASAGYYMFGVDVDDQITLSLESHSKAVTAMKALTWLIVLTGRFGTLDDNGSLKFLWQHFPKSL